ncbi:MAG: hypothetical protein R2795_04245 [Saprospiraceae bacterium]
MTEITDPFFLKACLYTHALSFLRQSVRIASLGAVPKPHIPIGMYPHLIFEKIYSISNFRKKYKYYSINVLFLGCIPNGMQADVTIVFLPSVPFLPECCSKSMMIFRQILLGKLALYIQQVSHRTPKENGYPDSTR